MEHQHESELVKRLEHLGIAVDVSPTGTTLTFEQIYTSGTPSCCPNGLGNCLEQCEQL